MFPLEALKRHLLSPSCSTDVSLLVFLDPLGLGFVCPWSTIQCMMNKTSATVLPHNWMTASV